MCVCVCMVFECTCVLACMHACVAVCKNADRTIFPSSPITGSHTESQVEYTVLHISIIHNK